jgi:S-adenosylmethionine uptake transporter
VFGGALCGQSGGAAPSGPARRPGEIAFFQSLFIALFMAPAAPWLGMVPRSGPVVGTIAGAAVLASVSVVLLSWGWARAQAHRLLPVEYSAFVWSALPDGGGLAKCPASGPWAGWF